VTLSIIIPVLDEAALIGETLCALQALRGRGAQVIVVDGGSTDETRAIAAPLADHVISAPRGRARQMNAGAALANGDALLFLHADSRLPRDADTLISQALESRIWGRFDVRLSGQHWLLRAVESLMNLRSRFTGIATGDQGIFVRRREFWRHGGYPEIDLMEDIALSRKLKRAGKPACLRQKIVASSRRWEREGVLRTIVEMWLIRLGYFIGARPAQLARRYERRRIA
jgi:rSAM/selenodomain-associated transferase 2